jgi:hypothetical protein
MGFAMSMTGVVLPALFLAGHSYAQEDSSEVQQNASLAPMVIPRINGPVELDGLSTEAAWDGIEPLPMVVHMPNFGSAPSETTEILLAFDDDNLYVAGRLYDSEPAKIQSPSKKRDQTGITNDWFGVVLDTFNDKENALFFATMPSGLRTDITIFNDAQGELPFTTSWNTFWDVATVRSEEGWFAEMRIPISSLRFQSDGSRVVMGLIALRLIARKTEVHIFPAIERKWGGFSILKPSQAQEVVFEALRSRRPLYVAPYVLGGVERSFELNDSGTAYLHEDRPTHEAGLDVKYGLTSNLTLDLTLNTDFAQVEADDQQINLTRFSLFFPEKRLFFQERSAIFDFGFCESNRLFYSRRIGIHEGDPVRIYGGARVVGRVGGWDLGFINMQTAPVEDLSSENHGVLRMRRQIMNPYSYVGAMVTSKIGADGRYNTAYGLDGILRLFGDEYLSLRLAQTFDGERNNNLVSLDPARVFVNWERRTTEGLGYDLMFSRSGRDFDPEMGYQRRSDFTRFGNTVGYGWLPGEESRVLQHRLSADGFAVVNNENWEVESAEVGPAYRLFTKSDIYFDIGPKLFYENVPEVFSLSHDVDVPQGRYTFFGVSGSVRTPRASLLWATTTFDAGSFYDGRRFSLGTTPTWSVSNSLELSGTVRFNWISFPDRAQEFNTRLIRLRALFMLNTKFSATAFVQYNSADDVVISNVRIRYNPREGNDLYVVYNEGLNTDRFREVPALPRTSRRTLLLKYTYTFNLS